MLAPDRLTRLLLLIALPAFLAGCGTLRPGETVPARNLENGLALKGYDAVAYFTRNEAIKGDPAISTTWDGATWRFVSAANRSTFLAEPGKYAPAYGGFCAYAIAHNRIADIDPDQWAVVDGKLYLNNNFLSQKLWDLDRRGEIVDGDRNWAAVTKTTPAS